MAFDIPDIDETQMPLLHHLLELRARLMRSLLVMWLGERREAKARAKEPAGADQADGAGGE